MKKLKILNICSVIMFFVMITATSCLKDDEHYLDFSGNAPLIEIPETPSASSGFVIRGIEMLPSIDINVPINLASPNPVGEDITVTLQLDPDGIVEKNLLLEKSGSSTRYEIFPATLYTVDSWSVTIPAGKNLVNLPIHIKADKVDLTKLYLLPVKIASVSPSSYTIASNFYRILIQVLVKNKWDGVYTVTGTMGGDSPGFVGSYPKTIHLVTQGPSSCGYFDPDLNGGIFGYKFDAAGTGSYFGNWAPIFNFSPSGVITSIDNYYADPAPRNRRFALDGTNNKVNADKSIDVSYHMVYNASSTRAFVVEHYVYKGPRP